MRQRHDLREPDDADAEHERDRAMRSRERGEARRRDDYESESDEERDHCAGEDTVVQGPSSPVRSDALHPASSATSDQRPHRTTRTPGGTTSHRASGGTRPPSTGTSLTRFRCPWPKKR